VGSPVGTPAVTQVSTKKVTVKGVTSGDYYLITPGSCGYDIVKTLIKNQLAGITTNVVVTATTTVGASNFVASETVLTFFTNNIYEVYACSLQTPTPQLYQGIGKVNFVNAQYDSDFGQNFDPITNNYTMEEIVNYQPVLQRFQRIVTQPDILLDAEDLASPNVSQIGAAFPPIQRTISYTQDPQQQGAVAESGPGTITDYPTTFIYNDAGAILGFDGDVVNGADTFLSIEPSIFTWASYDSSTNAPFVYPDAASLKDLEGQLLLRISPASPLQATNGVAYSQTFTTTGGAFTPPYTWSLTTNALIQTYLPAGLNLSAQGVISGTPTNDPQGTYDFILEMTDTNSRSITWNYSINIDQ
jgi:hypothetical protein